MTPTGRDGALICQLLQRVGIACEACDSWDSVLKDMCSGAGAVVVAEEALTSDVVERLSNFLKNNRHGRIFRSCY